MIYPQPIAPALTAWPVVRTAGANQASAWVSIKVLIADDHAMVRGALGHLIDSEPGLEVVALAHDGASTLQQLAAHACDVLMLDLTMPEPSGCELISLVRERWPQQHLLVVSMHNTPRIVRAALNAGANGYITKDSEPETLLHALRVVAAGGRYVEPRLMDAMLFAPTPAARLTPRETDILQRLAAGQSNSAIARSLYITDKTVSTHKANLMAKLDIHNLADLLRYAMDIDLAPKL
jgi:DNA-binding NarL/FixJ family response regulator